MSEWTLAELVARAAQALAAADVRAPNGRVTGLPDGRVIRWYATIGLVDRPSAMRGRTALYGPRHLLQLVAVKRRQAQGRTLAEIQIELTGATDDTLRRVAAIPASQAGIQADRAGIPADHAVDPGDHEGTAGVPAGHQSPLTRSRFWASPPAAPNHEPNRGSVAMLHGVVLDGVTILLSAAPDADDLAAIRDAARPLLDLLRDRGLLTRSEGAAA